MAKIASATLLGINAALVEVEASFITALPGFNITGLASSEVQEAKPRVQSALVNIKDETGEKFKFPALKININISPSDLPKHGSHFDLAIALLIAANSYSLDTEGFYAFGELGLDGALKPSNAIYLLVLDLAIRCQGAKVIVPYFYREHLSCVDGLRLFYVKTLEEAIELLKDEASYTLAPLPLNLPFKSMDIGGTRYYYEDSYPLDFFDVRGQARALRAALISSSGMHNLILEGSPGMGKSMIAKRMAYILPPMALASIIDNIKINVLDNKEIVYDARRPFRTPHQSASKSSILGSVSTKEVRPGEIALANNGILFFDELPHFPRAVLEALREPLENNKLSISRVMSKVEYETNFLFIGALNPCPCGYLNSESIACKCSSLDIARYRARLSGPFLDRIDLYVKMSEEPLTLDGSSGGSGGNGSRSGGGQGSPSSKAMHARVMEAFKRQMQRGQLECNGKLSEQDIARYCILSSEAETMLLRAVKSLSLSNRSVDKVKKVARTIADLDASDLIEKTHILEAISYRNIN